MNTAEVKQRMNDLGISPTAMSEELGMDVSTYYRKMQKNGDEFSAIDLITIKRVLQLSDKQALDFLLS